MRWSHGFGNLQGAIIADKSVDYDQLPLKSSPLHDQAGVIVGRSHYKPPLTTYKIQGNPQLALLWTKVRNLPGHYVWGIVNTWNIEKVSNDTPVTDPMSPWTVHGTVLKRSLLNVGWWPWGRTAREYPSGKVCRKRHQVPEYGRYGYYDSRYGRMMLMVGYDD
mgnify:CR=1 FL=1